MSDPRNAAHDKRVAQEQKHHGGQPGGGAPGQQQSGKKSKKKQGGGAPAQGGGIEEIIAAEAQAPKKGPAPELEGALVVLAQLKDLAFHANAHQGRLAEMMLTVEDKLKQKAFANTIGELYSAQADLHTKLTALIENYATEC